MTTLLEHMGGSRLYHTHTESSDYDIRGVFVAPIDQKLGLTKYIDTIALTREYPGRIEDVHLYELSKFLRLALANNPTILDTIHFTEHSWQVLHPLWHWINSRRNDFMTNRYVENVRGWVTRELKTTARYIEKGSYKEIAHVYRLISTMRNYEDTGTYSPILGSDDVNVFRQIKTCTGQGVDYIYHADEWLVSIHDYLATTRLLTELPDTQTDEFKRWLNQECQHIYRQVYTM